MSNSDRMQDRRWPSHSTPSQGLRVHYHNLLEAISMIPHFPPRIGRRSLTGRDYERKTRGSCAINPLRSDSQRQIGHKSVKQPERMGSFRSLSCITSFMVAPRLQCLPVGVYSHFSPPLGAARRTALHSPPLPGGKSNSSRSERL